MYMYISMVVYVTYMKISYYGSTLNTTIIIIIMIGNALLLTSEIIQLCTLYKYYFEHVSAKVIIRQ